MKKRLLIVEDDMNINNMLHEALTLAGYEVVQAFSGTEAMLNVKVQTFDLILLDLMLPGMKGEEFICKFRKESLIPIIVISAKDELDSKVEVLSCGADDYITKPFELKEVIARITVQLRHSSNELNEGKNDNQSINLSHKELLMRKDTYEVTIKGLPLALTKQEYKIMELLMMYPTKVFSKQAIYDYAWDEYFAGEDKTINVHISNIRLKIKKVSEQDYIDTVWGIGFKLSK